MPLIADKRERVYEGVKLHCGALFALNAMHRFQTLYIDKHGSGLENAIRNSSADSNIKYARREADVYERYMLMRVHEYDKRFKPQSSYVFEGGVRE